MDKLQWFKFSYADWRMGKIQRCDEVTQSRFINLCCLYWSKECSLSYEDAEIEIDKNHLDVLLSKKIVINIDGFINISFLDEQFLEIEGNRKDRSISGVVGNLKRWHPLIHKRYENKEISLDEAINLSKSIAFPSHTDSTPIAEQSQSIAEKRRGEKRRGEKTKQEVPTLEEFIAHAVERKKNVCTEEVRLKYFAWLDNNWSITRNNKTEPIKNWKSSLTNTVKYLGEAYKQPSKPIEETFEERIIRLNLEAKANG
jgi:hypothetical protein